MSNSQNRGASVQRTLEMAAYGVVIAYAVGFAAWNHGLRLDLRLWFDAPAVTVPAEMVAFAAFLGGYLLASFFAAFGALRRFSEVRRLKRLSISLQDELTRLRSDVPPGSPAASGNP